jgi:Predicted membrane protein (DUF2231)
MQSTVRVAGHPLHPMLIVFPLGLLATAVIFDIIYLVSHNSMWTQVAYYMIGAGVIGGLAAALPGVIDWFGIPSGSRGKRAGLLHERGCGDRRALHRELVDAAGQFGSPSDGRHRSGNCGSRAGELSLQPICPSRGTLMTHPLTLSLPRLRRFSPASSGAR